MPTLLWVLVILALWTLAVLVFGLGGARVYRVLQGDKLTDFAGGMADGGPFYNRATRAHLNCLETLPVYMAVAVTAVLLNITSPVLNNLALAVLAGRIAQSIVHLALPQTERVIMLRSVFFAIQIVAIAWMAIVVLTHAVPGLNP